MNKEFLNKVLEQLVNETILDYKKERISPSFFPPNPFSLSIPFTGATVTILPPSVCLVPPSFPTTHPLFFTVAPSPVSFSRHCKNVYALNEQEIKYVWKRKREKARQ